MSTIVSFQVTERITITGAGPATGTCYVTPVVKTGDAALARAFQMLVTKEDHTEFVERLTDLQNGFIRE